jgi:hypothetical protein
MKSKKCTICKQVKTYDHYYIRPNGKPYSQCEPCKKLSSKKWYQLELKNKEKYDIEGKICPNCKIYKTKDLYYILEINGQPSTYCIECELDKYNWNNPSRKETKQKWRNTNMDQIREYNLKYHHNVRKLDPNYRILQSLRSGMHRVLDEKTKHTSELTDCDSNFLKKWLEFQFNEKMNWDNYGLYWEIDHTKPCNSFDLTSIDEQYKCFNWKNLRPLEIELNRSKKDKIILEHIFQQEINVINFNRRQSQIAGTL